MISRVKDGSKLKILNVGLIEGKTKPPSRLTESDLLEEIVRNSVGTDATRTTFSEIIIKRKHVTRRVKSLNQLV